MSDQPKKLPPCVPFEEIQKAFLRGMEIEEKELADAPKVYPEGEGIELPCDDRALGPETTSDDAADEPTKPDKPQ